MNGIVKSPILDSTGTPAPASAMWQVPGTQSPYFGWMGEEGFTTIRLDMVKALTPHPQFRMRGVVWLEGNTNVVINADDMARLMKRLGWREPGTERT